jgi:predicted NBD/HSP70 family sugar kinase
MKFRKLNIHRTGRVTHRDLRDQNEVLVLNLVRERQPISRIDIAEWTGLEGSTVSKIAARLLESGFIFEDGVGAASPQGGRKKRFLHLNPEKVYAIGVDLEPHRIMLALSDFSGRIIRSLALDNERDPEKALAAVARGIKKLLQSRQLRERVAGIGVSLVGLVDPKEGRILAGENLGWGDDVPVGSILRSSLNMDLPIYYDNGSRLAALAEIWFGKHARQQPQDLVFIDVGEGVGAGIVIQGQLYHGSLHGAGEFGHISLDPLGPICNCGGRGCLEVFTADQAILARYTELCRAEGMAAEVKRKLSIDELVDRGLKGNPRAIEALRQTATYLGRGLIPVIYSVNPEVIVLGGPVVKAWEIIYPEIRRVLAAQVTRFYSSHVSITPSTLEERPSLVGAIALVLARAFSIPSQKRI